MAHDIFDNWFKLEPPEEGTDKERFNETVQKVLLMLNAQNKLYASQRGKTA